MIKVNGIHRYVANNGLDELSNTIDDAYLEYFQKNISINSDYITEGFSFEDALYKLGVWLNKRIKIKHMLDDDNHYCNYLDNDINLEDESTMKRRGKYSLAILGRCQYPRNLSRLSTKVYRFTLNVDGRCKAYRKVN